MLRVLAAFPSFPSQALSTVHNAVQQSVSKRKRFVFAEVPKKKSVERFISDDRIVFFLAVCRNTHRGSYLRSAGTCESHDAIDNNRHDRHGALLFVGLAVVPPDPSLFQSKVSLILLQQSFRHQFSSPRSENNELRASSRELAIGLQIYLVTQQTRVMRLYGARTHNTRHRGRSFPRDS